MLIRSLTLAGALALMAGSAALAQSTTLDGVFSEAQAEAGLAVYEENCSACHAATLRGTPGGPGIVGVRFSLNWADRSVGELYQYIHDFMPAGMGGTLSPDEYIQVTAYILQQNDYPAGEEDLPADADLLEEIMIVKAE